MDGPLLLDSTPRGAPDSPSPLSPLPPTEQRQRDREERLTQRVFTVSMALTSLIGLVALTYETRWISALGGTQLQSYSVGHSACFYMSRKFTRKQRVFARCLWV